MGFPDFGKKNKGGKKDLPTQLPNSKGTKVAKKLLKRKKPTQY